MGYFDDDEITLPTDGSFDTGNDEFEPIPDGTQVLALIEEIGWEEANEYQPARVKARWSVMKPSEFENRKVFQNVKLGDPDEDKARKAKAMLAAIDANCGGNLVASNIEPTDYHLTKNLCNKPMMLKVGVWEMDDRSGNWVIAVSPKGGATGVSQNANQAPEPSPSGDDNEEVPF